MKRDDIITLSDGQTAKIIKGDESEYQNCYIVELENGQKRVVDRETLTIATMANNHPYRHAYNI